MPRTPTSIRMPPPSPSNLLEVQDLQTHFFTAEGIVKAVDGVTFTVAPQETLGLIGESGCGKSVTAHSIMRIVPKPGRILGGEIRLRLDAGFVDLADRDLSGAELRAIRGKDVSMVFQEPMTSLSPVHTIGNQIRETIYLHRTRDRQEATAIALDILARVGISNPEQRIAEYPHQLSGGMRQRVMIAIALACRPRLLIADEPTTALDVTVQAQILELIKELQAQFHMAVLYITHDLGVIAEVCSRVAVMYLGRIVEYGTVQDIFHNPLHPYTVRLLRSIPKLGHTHSGEPLAAIQGSVPSPLNLPEYCGFFDRCEEAMAGHCNRHVPALIEVAAGHYVRCFLHSEAVETGALELLDTTAYADASIPG